MNFIDYDDEEQGLYEEGFWEWNNESNSLAFISQAIPMEEPKKLTEFAAGPIDFKNEVDVLDELRFHRRIQRKYVNHDVITLQDVKDVALFTTPRSVLNPALIKTFHLRATDRFLRALILYFQYFFQVEREMEKRIKEKETKIETANSKKIEETFSDDLEDLRILVAKEYSSIVQGTCGFQNIHHLGPSKKLPSLSNKDIFYFETILAISIQIVYLSLERINLRKIENETHRLFKSDKFNVAKHHSRIKMFAESQQNSSINAERLKANDKQKNHQGKCLSHRNKILTRSPLLNEVFCQRPKDFRLLGLGVAKYSSLTSRLRYLENAIIAPENQFQAIGVSLGIIGLPRNKFDSMLRFLQFTTDNSKSSIRHNRQSKSASMSKIRLHTKVYPDVYLPITSDAIDFCDLTPEPLKSNYNKDITQTQQQKWLTYIQRKR